MPNIWLPAHESLRHAIAHSYYDHHKEVPTDIQCGWSRTANPYPLGNPRSRDRCIFELATNRNSDCSDTRKYCTRDRCDRVLAALDALRFEYVPEPDVAERPPDMNFVWKA